MSDLRSNSLFDNLDDEQAGYVGRKMTVRNFMGGSEIIKENSYGNSLFVLIKGRVRIIKELVPLIEGYDLNPEDRKEIVVDDSMKFYFGEMSLFDTSLKRTASVIAETEVVAAELDKDKFEEILNERKDIGVVILKNIALKLSRLLDTSNVELSKMITAFTLSLKL